MNIPAIGWADSGPVTQAFVTMRRLIACALGLKGAGSISASSGPAGTVLRLVRQRRPYAALSGSSNPYAAAEVFPAAGGGWEAVPGGDLGDAWEVAGVTGLDSKVVRLRPGDNGDWRFRYDRRGVQTPDDCEGVTCFNVHNCVYDGDSSAAPGVIVEVYDANGDEVASGLTDSGGAFCAALPSNLSHYSVRFTTPGGYAILYESQVMTPCQASVSYIIPNGSKVHVYSCFDTGAGIEGAEVTTSIGASATTNASGDAVFYYGPSTPTPETPYTGTVTLPTGPVRTYTATPGGSCSVSLNFIDRVCVAFLSCCTQQAYPGLVTGGYGATDFLDRLLPGLDFDIKLGGASIGSGTTTADPECVYLDEDIIDTTDALTMELSKSGFVPVTLTSATWPSGPETGKPKVLTCQWYGGIGGGTTVIEIDATHGCTPCQEPLTKDMSFTDSRESRTLTGAMGCGRGSFTFCRTVVPIGAYGCGLHGTFVPERFALTADYEFDGSLQYTGNIIWHLLYQFRFKDCGVDDARWGSGAGCSPFTGSGDGSAICGVSIDYTQADCDPLDLTFEIPATVPVTVFGSPTTVNTPSPGTVTITL